MKPLIKEALRWCVIVAAGGYGVRVLSEAAWGTVTRWEGWGDIFFFLICLLYTAPFLAVAWFVFRRQYRKLFLVLGIVGALFLFMALVSLPGWLGIEQYFHDNLRDIDTMRAHPWINAFTGPFFLLCLFVPIYGAAWFYRICRNLADRGTPGWETRKQVKTRATRWLIWLGVLCMLLPPLIGMITTFNQITQAPDTLSSPESVSDYVAWIADTMSIGFLLIFLGLVRRRPVSKPNDNAAPLEPVLAQACDPR